MLSDHELRDDGGIGIPPTPTEDPGPAPLHRRGGRWPTRYLERISEVE